VPLRLVRGQADLQGEGEGAQLTLMSPSRCSAMQPSGMEAEREQSEWVRQSRASSREAAGSGQG